MKIGIALASYLPHPDFFLKQLESIEAQTHSDWVCIITSDSPLEETFKHAPLNKFKNHSRFRWHENPQRLGSKKNFERAIQLCLKENVNAVACSDQDDVWYPEKLQRCLEVLVQKPPLSLVHSDMHVLIVDEKGEKLLPGTTWSVESRGVHHCQPQHLLVRNVVAGCAMLFDAEIARRYPHLPEEFDYHDHWYALVASVHGGVYPISEPLFAYRQHDRNELGVTPYPGMFHVPSGFGIRSVLAKCRQRYLWSKGMALAARREKIPLKPWIGWLFLLPLDFGLGLFGMALSNWLFPTGRDLALARACIARALGKALFFVS
jgi:hypothetical protein